jgi:hypothetical protein
MQSRSRDWERLQELLLGGIFTDEQNSGEKETPCYSRDEELLRICRGILQRFERVVACKKAKNKTEEKVSGLSSTVV